MWSHAAGGQMLIRGLNRLKKTQTRKKQAQKHLFTRMSGDVVSYLVCQTLRHTACEGYWHEFICCSLQACCSTAGWPAAINQSQKQSANG